MTCLTATPGRVPPDWGGSLTEEDYSTLSRAWIPRELADAAMLRRVSDLEGREAIGHKGKRDCAGILSVAGGHHFRLSQCLARRQFGQ